LYSFRCAPVDLSFLNRQQNKPSCLTVRPCHMHYGSTWKTSVPLQKIWFFD